MEKIVLKLILLLLAISTGCSEDIELKESLTALSRDYTEANKPPGLAMSVIKNSELFWSYSYGYADVENKSPFDSSVIMNIGSVSKTITTVAIFKLLENGLLDINSDINEYLDFPVRNPNYPNTPITLKQLLTHTSSIKDGSIYQQSYQCGESNMSLSQWIKHYFSLNGKYYNPNENFHSWKPGEGYKYSNVAYGLLGLIAENVSGLSFSEYCKLNIFDPLNMHKTSWFRKDLENEKLAKQYALV